MKIRFLVTFNAILALIAVNLLVACQPKSESSAPGTKQFGTSDTGGGTGIDNKVYESYIVDISKHPAFINFVLPLFQNLKNRNDGDQPLNALAMNPKTWYIAPVDLEKVGKETLGVSFHNSDTQQIARQTKKEIWIDSRIFEKMSLKDQGDLIVHEIIMAAYFMKFMPFKEICVSFGVTQKQNGQQEKSLDCENLPPFIDENYKSETTRPLNAEDNENIRYATGWFLENTKNPIDEIEFIKMLRLKGFDKRFFNPANYKEQMNVPPLILSGKEVMAILKATEVAGYLPDRCREIQGSLEGSCKLDFTEGTIDVNSNGTVFKMPAIVMKIYFNGELIQTFHSAIADNMNLSGNRDQNGATSYLLTLGDFQNVNSKRKVGQRFSTAFAILRPISAENGNLQLDKIITKTNVLTKIDLTTKEICEFRVPKRTKAFEVGLIVQRENAKKEVVDSAIEHMGNFGYCTKEMIE